MKRLAWLFGFSLVCSLATAPASFAAWPTAKADRCWRLVDAAGAAFDGWALRLHVVPLGGKAAVVTGRALIGAIPTPVGGTASVEGSTVTVVGSMPELGGGNSYFTPGSQYQWFVSGSSFSISFARDTLASKPVQNGIAWRPVTCRSLPPMSPDDAGLPPAR